ncbi:MAG: ribosome biogenesis GTPase Der [Clostridiales bacterium]|nr:ribosome biogenesis GTPase Der [Clostridiales bacterium]
MPKPIVAIVGRPNVGKSTFFNHIVGRRISIVHDEPGVTRDRIFQDTQWLGREFTIVDTGGLEPKGDDEFVNLIRGQVDIAIEMADVIIFLVDGSQGITPTDRDIANILRRVDKELIVCVNKIDAPHMEDNIYEFYNLGLGTPISVSATHKRGFGDFLDELISRFPEDKGEVEDKDIIKIAVVGKPNVGKSSLINKMLGEDRVIVSDIPGTTRDAVDTIFKYGHKEYIIIDTAGIRRKSRIDESLERYSVMRALTAIRRCDIALIVMDATDEISTQDVRIAGLVHEEGKASIVLMNKWDLVQKDTNTVYDYRNSILTKLSFMDYVEHLTISAKTGRRLNRIIDLVEHVYEGYTRRIRTGVLNECLEEAILMVEPPSDRGRRLKIYYGTQVSTKPPTFVIFVNDTKLVHYSYKRYLENYFRKTFDLEGTPIRIFFRQRRGGSNI